MTPSPSTIHRTVRLHRAQHAFCHSPATYRAFCGGRGAGKSFAGSYDLIRRARRGAVYMIVGPTYSNLRDSSMRTFIDLARELGVLDPTALRTSAPPQLTLTTGAEILFRSGDDPERLRGPSLAGGWLDEASQMPRAVYDIMIASLRHEGRQGWLSATFTPKGPTSWTFSVFNTGKPDTAIFKARTDQNPFNPPAFAATLRRQYGETQWAKQELGGEFVAIEGAEFPPDWFDWPGFWLDTWPEKLLYRAVYLDPSKGASDTADYQALVRAALCVIDGRNTVVLDAELHREDVALMARRAVRAVRDWHPVDACACEDNGTMGFIVPEFHRQMKALDVIQPWVPVTNRLPKLQRIRRVGAYLSQRGIRVLDTPGGRLLKAQLSEFPLGQFDDGCDAAAGALDLLERLAGAR